MGQRLQLNSRFENQHGSVVETGGPCDEATPSTIERGECGIYGLRALACSAARSGPFVTPARIEGTERRQFSLLGSSRVVEVMLACGFAVALATASVPGSAQETPEQRSSAKAVARLLRHDESLRAAGLLRPAKELPPRSNPWAFLGTALLSGVALAGVGRSAKRLLERKQSEGKASDTRQAIAEALESPFRSVRVNALTTLQGRSDLAQFPVKALIPLCEQRHDAAIAALARKLVVKHPLAPDLLLREIATTDRFQSIRMDALNALALRRA